MRTLVVCEKTAEAAERMVRSYRSIIDCAEIRLDFAEEKERAELLDLPGRFALPMIATARLPADGGVWKDDEESRVRLLLEAAGKGFAFVDLEMDRDPELFRRLRRVLDARGGKVIASLHRFSALGAHGGPEAEAEALLERILSAGEEGTVVKAAVFLGGSRDLLAFTRMALRLKERPGERILIGMGPYGVPARIAYRRFGSLLTYCAPAGRDSAPGQLSPEALENDYHLSSVTGDERFYGIIGNPVLHTRSPGIHNGGYRAAGLNALYLPFPADDLDAFFATADLLQIGGVSVTVPFKEEVRSFLESEDDKVRATGACNTVLIRGGARTGTNTDIDGFTAPLAGRWEGRPGGSALVIGAGGAARTAVFSIAPFFDRVVVANRNLDRARRLVEELVPDRGEAVPLDGVIGPGPYRLVVQTTSVGMSPDDGADPAPGFRFTGKELAYDIIYTPEKTAFLRRAEAAGCEVIGGLAMLRLQAERQFTLFTGRPFPKGPERTENS